MPNPILIFLALAGPAPGDRLDDYIQAAMKRQHIPGMSVAVVQKGKVVKCRGYGLASVELKAPATADTVYELASLTKAFVASAILRLKQEGKISLEDPISAYVPNLPSTWSAITVRNLLSHTSGIPDYANDLRHDFDHDASPEAIVEFVKASPLKFVAGSQWGYSNTDYILLGMLIQHVTGVTWARYLDQTTLKPLGMASTQLDTADGIYPGRASGYLWLGLVGGLRSANFLYDRQTNHGDRGLLSTVKDLAKWDAALSTATLLAEATKKEMWSPIKLNDGSAYMHGLGWFMDRAKGHLHISHAGGTPGSATMLARYPEDGLTVIVLANGGAADVSALDRDIASFYIPDLGPQHVVKLSARDLDAFTGYGVIWDREILTIVRKDNSLLVDDGNRLTGVFKPLSSTEFQSEDSDRKLKFTLYPDGKVASLTVQFPEFQTTVQPIGPLFTSVEPGADSDLSRTRRIGYILKAFERGGKAVAKVEGVADQARNDYQQGQASEFAGLQSISYLAEFDVSGRGIVRHGGKVGKVVYYRLHGAPWPFVLVYLTPEGLVTDQDVVGG